MLDSFKNTISVINLSLKTKSINKTFEFNQETLKIPEI